MHGNQQVVWKGLSTAPKKPSCCMLQPNGVALGQAAALHDSHVQERALTAYESVAIQQFAGLLGWPAMRSTVLAMTQQAADLKAGPAQRISLASRHPGLRDKLMGLVEAVRGLNGLAGRTVLGPVRMRSNRYFDQYSEQDLQCECTCDSKCIVLALMVVTHGLCDVCLPNTKMCLALLAPWSN